MENKKTILIIEDEESLAGALHDKFATEGFDALIARNGEEGLSLALQKHPDLILLDIVMPKMDGLTMLKSLREDTWGKDAQVIILTNLSGNGEVSKAINQGVYEYIVKTDIKIEDLVAKVKEHLVA
ncbi:MAG: response regulator [Candidatus Paceibacterota bacterium]|jgi:DNA-binding response OmpR family regulator